MTDFNIDLSSDSASVLDRVIEAYGFPSKMMLAQHLDMAASSLSSRYKRGGFPADIVVRCMAETGVSLEWLATGKGEKHADQPSDILRLPRRKLVDGQLFDAGYAVFDKVFFRAGVPLPGDPFCLQDEKAQYVIDKTFDDIYDGEWLVNIEGKISVRSLIRIPVRKVRVSGVGTAFDCALEEIEVLGRVVITIIN